MTACAQEVSNPKQTTTDSAADQRVPVTVLTGFLGSGKTTLLNRILTEQHGKRIAVIENEFGEIGIDHELVVQSDEEIFEMNNGCICCTVRGDLIRILGRLMRRKHTFDHIIIETTGMADPGPVAQTFFMDDEMKTKLRLDAIITVVDCKHVLMHQDSDECHAQLAFADIVLLNKCDLVSADTVTQLRDHIQTLNHLAQVHETVQANAPIDQLLGVHAFDLEARAAETPTFLQEELPFEWAGLYDLEPGRYRIALNPGPDPTIDIVFGGPGLERADVFDRWKRDSILLYSSDAEFVSDDARLTAAARLYRVPVDAGSGAVVAIEIGEAGRYVLFTQHLAEEFDLQLSRDGQVLEPLQQHAYASPHEHDDSVGSIGIRLSGDLDPERFERWMVDLLRRRGTDIFRSKGVLSLAGDAQRFVFQGVHMLFDGQPGRTWEADCERENQLVFIGRDLDRSELTDGLRACLV